MAAWIQAMPELAMNLSPGTLRKGMIDFSLLGPKRNHFKDDELVCYCFQYTKKQIESDYTKNGRSMILERITAEKKAGGCDCARKNPKGR